MEDKLSLHLGISFLLLVCEQDEYLRSLFLLLQWCVFWLNKSSLLLLKHFLLKNLQATAVSFQTDINCSALYSIPSAQYFMSSIQLFLSVQFFRLLHLYLIVSSVFLVFFDLFVNVFIKSFKLYGPFTIIFLIFPQERKRFFL